jgi:hypothetical protein
MVVLINQNILFYLPALAGVKDKIIDAKIIEGRTFI